MFQDRHEAGKLLAKKLEKYRGTPSVVLAIPRGGVVVAKEMAKILHLPLDIVSAKKIGHPINTELAVGAITSRGETYLNQKVIRGLDVSPLYLARESFKQQKEAQRRDREYRASKKLLNVAKKNVILVDDGVATGATVFAAIKDLRIRKADRVIVAIPVAPRSIINELKSQADEVVVLETPEPFFAVGNFYQEFPQVSDEEVKQLLNRI